MTAALHQLTMTYAAEQDRMLLRIGTGENTEYQLWLTRRFVKVMWGALIQTMERDPEMNRDLMPGCATRSWPWNIRNRCRPATSARSTTRRTPT